MARPIVYGGVTYQSLAAVRAAAGEVVQSIIVTLPATYEDQLASALTVCLDQMREGTQGSEAFTAAITAAEIVLGSGGLVPA